MLLTLWGFIGVETATTPAGSVINPRKTIPKAILGEPLCVAGLYIINSIGIVGIVPPSILKQSNAPMWKPLKLFLGTVALRSFNHRLHCLYWYVECLDVSE